MQRKFITNLALLLFLNLLVKPFWILGIDRSVQNAVGPGEYGFYFAILNFSFLFNILLDFGITNFNNRNIAQHGHLLKKHFPGILSMRIVLAFFYLIVTMAIGLLAGYEGRQMVFLAILGGNQVLASLVLYLRSNISGLLMFRTDSVISVLDRSLMILICGLLLWTNIGGEDFAIEWFVLAQTAAYLLTAVVAFLVVVRKSTFRRLKWDKAFNIMIMKKSFPFAVLILLMTFYNRIDSVLLERLIPGEAGDREAGIYASAYRLLDAANQFAYLFAVLLLPIFSRMIRQKEDPGGMVKLSYSLLYSAAVSIAVTSAFYSYELMDLFYVAHVEESARVFEILMWCFIPFSTTYVFGTLLTAKGNLFHLNIIAASGMVLNIGLNLWLIPLFGAPGSAVASLVTQLITALAQVILAVMYFGFRSDPALLIRLVVFVPAVILATMFSQKLAIPWGQSYLLAVGSSVLLSVFIGLIRPIQLIRMIKKESPAPGSSA